MYIYTYIHFETMYMRMYIYTFLTVYTCIYIYIFHIHSQTGNVANGFSKFCSVRLSAPKNTNGGWQFDLQVVKNQVSTFHSTNQKQVFF